MTESDNITRLLSEVGAGRPQAADDLLVVVYDQLRAIAHARMRGERNDHTLDATALVHEAFLRLVGNDEIMWENRGHFFVAAAEAMRRTLGMHHQFTRFAMDGLSTAYAGLGDTANAMQVHVELDQIEIELAERPDALPNDLNTQAWHLLTCAYVLSRNPHKALALAERACALEESGTGRDLWNYLDTLAMAQHMTGDTQAAAATQQRAIDLIPPDAPQSVRTNLEERLHQYQQSTVPDGGS